MCIRDSSTVGQNKTDALAARCRDINPDVRLHLICARYDLSLIHI